MNTVQGKLNYYNYTLIEVRGELIMSSSSQWISSIDDLFSYVRIWAIKRQMEDEVSFVFDWHCLLHICYLTKYH